MTKCMRAIIKCLGVEVGEVFKITDAFNNKSHRYFRFTEADIEVSDDCVTWEMSTSEIWKCLLTGVDKIVRLSWKPKKDEMYYVPAIGVHPEYMYQEFIWDKDNADIERYNAGLVYKTKEEATAVAEKMLKNLSKKG